MIRLFEAGKVLSNGTPVIFFDEPVCYVSIQSFEGGQVSRKAPCLSRFNELESDIGVIQSFQFRNVLYNDRRCPCINELAHNVCETCRVVGTYRFNKLREVSSVFFHPF